jgi:CBS domain-containing protein
MRTVKNILDSKSKMENIIQPHAKVIYALNYLKTVDLSYLVVMDEQEFKGIFSERDYARNVILQGRASNTTDVGEVMTVGLPKVYLDDTVEQCMNTMNANKTRYLLAYNEKEKFQGVITIHDLLRQVISNKEMVFDQTLTNRLLDQDESGKIF